MIYCVEDEGSIRDLMLYTLNMAGFEAQGFASSEPFWDAMKNERPELILLDIMLPGADGIAVLRRATPKSAAPAVLSLGEISLDPTRHGVSSGGREVVLTLKEYDLLKLLLEHPGQVFTREHLLSSVWGSDFIGESRTVDVHIGTLRTKLGAAGRQIQTVRGVGYKLEV